MSHKTYTLVTKTNKPILRIVNLYQADGADAIKADRAIKLTTN